MVASEAVTAGHVRKRLEALGYFSEPAIHVDERQAPIHANEGPVHENVQLTLSVAHRSPRVTPPRAWR